MNPTIVQLRGTVFIPMPIGYSDENRDKYLTMLPGGLVQSSVPSQVANMPAVPSLGAPWQIVKENIIISFGPNQVDIISNRVNDIDIDEDAFVNLCKTVFSIITETSRFNTRMAFAPLYAMDENETFVLDDWWKRVLFSTSYDGAKKQNINLTYVLKRGMDLNGKKLTLNLHHNFYDGMKMDNQHRKLNDSLMFGLDINTVPEQNLLIEERDVPVFFDKAILEKNKLMSSYFGI